MVAQVRRRSDSFQICFGSGLAFILAILFVISISAYLQFMNVENPYEDLSFSFFLFIVAYTLFQYFIIIRCGIKYIGRMSWAEIGWKPVRAWDFLIGIFGGGVAALAIYLFGFSLGAWDWAQFYEQQLQFSASQRILFLLIGLSAGFIEESLFRGYLQPALVRKLGLIAGIAVTSVVFATYHLKFSSTALGGKFLLGFVLGVLRNKDESLVRPTVAHALMWLLIGSI